MTAQRYIVSLYLFRGKPPLRRAVVGPASIATVEAAIAHAPAEIQAEVRAHEGVRFFIDHGCYRSTYIAPGDGIERFRNPPWNLVIGTVDEVLP